MIVSTLQMRILMREARNLKDKRRILKSIKDRLRNQFNVSVAEVDGQDVRQTGVLGVALVSNDRTFADKVFNHVLNLVRSTPGAELVQFEMDL